MNDEVQPVTTSDTPFAAFLKYHKHPIVGVIQDKKYLRRRVFVFARLENTDELTEEYYHGEPQVDPRYYYICSKEVLKILKEHI